MSLNKFSSSCENYYTTREQMARVKFNNTQLVNENKEGVWRRIFQVAGTDKNSVLAERLDRKENEVSNWKGESRGIPLEFIVDFCIEYKVSIDYILFGQAPGQTMRFTGSPKVTKSTGTNQISGINQGPGSNIAQHSISSGRGDKFTPEMGRIVKLLEYYGSPALFDKIETVIGQMYGVDPPIKLPNDK